MTFNALKYGSGTCQTWFDLQNSGSLTLAGALIDQIDDNSGNAIHTTGAGAARATLDAIGLNGYPAATFDDSHLMTFAQISGMNSASTVIMVVESDQDNSANSIGEVINVNNTGGAATPLPLMYATKATRSLTVEYPGLDLEFDPADGIDNLQPFISYSQLDSTDSSAEAGAFKSEATSVKTGASVAISNGGTSSIGLNAKMKFGELIIYNSVLPKEELQQLLLEIGEKWSIAAPKKIALSTQSLSSGKLVELFEIDSTEQGGALFRFVSAVDATNEISSIEYSGATAIAETAQPHTLSLNDSINISGVNQSDYNGDFLVTSVGDPMQDQRMLDSSVISSSKFLGLALRKIRTAYAGSCIRVRRSSDDTEMDIGFLGNGDFDKYTLITFLAGSIGYIRTWYDQTANGFNAEQSTDANQPYIDYEADPANPTIIFTNLQWLLLPSGSYALTGGSSTAFYKARMDSANLDRIFNMSAAGSLYNFQHDAGSGSLTFQSRASFGSGVTVTGVTDTNFNIYKCRRDGTTQAISANNGTEITNTSGQDAVATGATIGSFGGTSTDALDGAISEIIIYDANVSSSDSTIIYTDINNYTFSYAAELEKTHFSYTMLGTPTEIAQGANMLLTRLNNKMVYNGNDYSPIAFESEGFEWDGSGALPNPKIRVSNVGKILAASVIALNDLVGAKLTRIRTFRKHLDDGSDPDPYAIFPKDIYNFNRKTLHNKLLIEFELASPMEQDNVKLPGRQCLKRACSHRYRVWTGSSFDYTNATCPYVGTSYFTNTDTSTALPDSDQCAKQLDSCKLRFTNSPLPTRAFPGIGGTR